MRLIRSVAACCTLAVIAGCAGKSPEMSQVGPAPVASEAAGDGSDSIVVSAQRRDERLQDVPTVATAVGSPEAGQKRANRNPSRTAFPAPPPPPLMPAPSSQTTRFIPPVMVAADPGRERYDGEEVSPVRIARTEPVSTFSVDVDTGAYANARRYLTSGQLPPKDAVRSEELLNYFRYNYPAPQNRTAPFTVTTDVAVAPWNAQTRLLRIGLRGYDLARENRPPANLVFLMDVSGSMNSPDKLPLVKSALSRLAGEISAKDRVSIVVYAGASGLVLQPTSDTGKIREALGRLEAGGSTAGSAGLQLAYQVARDSFIKGGVNRVILATDGDFNVGVSDTKALIEMIEQQRDSGIRLTTLGFGTGNYNEAMMEQIANHGNGNYAYIDSALEAKKVLGDEMNSTLFTIAKDVKIQVEFNPALVSQYRLIGYENRALREEDFNNDRVDAGDIGAGHQVTAIYEIVPAGMKGWIAPRRYDDPLPAASAAKDGELAFVKLRYKMPNGKTSHLIEKPVAASLMAQATAPTGDFAFATAVAAFGQSLRGDDMLNGFTYTQIASLAGGQQDFWRQEFVKLVGVADGIRRE